MPRFDALAWLGRQGTRAVALSIFVGIAVPAVAATLRPIIGPAIFALLTLSFLRVDPTALRKLFARPGLLLIATAWTMLVLPTLVSTLLVAGWRDRIAPDLLTALVLQAATPPITAAPTLAILMGLDAAISLAVLIVSTLITPVVTPLLADWFVGILMPIAPLALGIKLALFLASALVASAAIRAWKGGEWLDRQKGRIDGLNVIVLFVFAIALMDGVALRVWTQPLTVIILVATAFAIALVQVAATTLAFWWCGPERAFVLGLAAGHRNMGLVLAILGTALGDMGWLYYSMAQFPIYLLPQILKPVARRIAG